MAKSKKNTLKEQNALLDEMIKKYTRLTGLNPEISFDPKNINSVLSAMREMEDSLDSLDEGFIGIQKSIRGMLQEMSKSNKAANDINSVWKGIDTTVKKLRLDQEGIEKLNKKQLLTLKQKLDAQKSEAKAASEVFVNQMKGQSSLSEQDMARIQSAENIESTFKDIEESISARIIKEKDFEDALGMTGAAASGLQGILDKIGAGRLADRLGLDSALKVAQEEASKLSANLKEGEKITLDDKMKVAAKFGKELGKNLVTSLGPVALLAAAIKAVVDAFLFLDSASGDVAKQMGVSAEQGQELVEASNMAAINSNDILVSTKDVVKAQMELNKVFGSSVQFSGDMAAEFASIQERTNLSSEAMGFFAEQSLHAGTSVKDQLENVVGMTMELNAQNGVSISRKEIEEGLGKLTKAQLLTAKHNTKELVNQVFQARMLGMELSEVESISKSLLDFESSIQSEMEAELLTGKQLNLETARQAALQGELATVAEEVAKQIGNAEEFGKMNVIQQEALAAAVGMTREGLADSLAEQEKQAALREMGFKDMSDAQNQYNEAVKNGTLTEAMSNELKEKGLLEQLESASAQEKMAATLEKIQSLFISIAGPLMEIITPIVDVLAPVLDAISTTLSYIVEGFKMMPGPLKVIIGLMALFAARAKIAAVFEVIKGAWSGLGGIPVVGPALAIAAIAAGIGFISKQKMQDGVIGPGGEMIVSGPKGSIQLDKEDSIIAGTDLGGKGKTKKEGTAQGPNIDLSQVIAELAAVKAVLVQLLEKKGDVYIDGNKAGYSLTLADSKMG
mgnify:FL=1